MVDFLSVVWNVDPVICQIGPIAIRYYSLLFIAGFPLGYWILTKCYKREGVDVQVLESLLYALLIGTVVGARLGHCLFYQPDYYLSKGHFLEIFQPWKGGLASHGGTIGVILAICWHARKYGKKYNFNSLWEMDRIAVVVCWAACCIRLGNLFNSEIYGGQTSLPWGFIFERRGEVVPKHPTQLYEALTYAILGVILTIAYFRKLDSLHRGWFSGIFFIGCFGMRFLIEFIKEPQVGFEEGMALNMGQLLSLPFVAFGIWCLWYSATKKIPARRTEPVKTHYCPPPKSQRR